MPSLHSPLLLPPFPTRAGHGAEPGEGPAPAPREGVTVVSGRGGRAPARAAAIPLLEARVQPGGSGPVSTEPRSGPTRTPRGGRAPVPSPVRRAGDEPPGAGGEQ